MKLSDFRKYRCMPFVKRGMKVIQGGRPGVITGANRSCNLNIRFEGNKHSSNCHPYYDIKYIDQQEKVIAEYNKR